MQPLHLLDLALLIGSLLLLMRLSGLRRPLRAALHLVGQTLFTSTGRLLLFLILVLLLLNGLETSVDGRVTNWLGWDFTPLAHAIEGTRVATIQAAIGAAPWDRFWAYLYLHVYPGLMLLPAFVFHARGQRQALGAYLGAAAINYLVSIPFYLFVPVTEVGWSALGAARPGVDEAWPRLAPLLRTSSGLDNCFPSLHASFSLTAAGCSLRYGPRALAWTASIVAALIVVSTWALAVHWSVDSLAGLLLAVCAVTFGPTIARRFEGRVAPGYPPAPAG